MNWGVQFQTPTYNVPHRVSPWIKWSYLPAFLALIPFYGIPASLAAAALAIRGVFDMPHARRMGWGMAAVPLAVAVLTLPLGLLMLFKDASPGFQFVMSDGIGEPDKVWFVIIMLGSFLASVTIHEPAHAMVAYWFGDTTAADYGRLTFNPQKHIHPIWSVVIPAITLFLGYFFGFASTPVNPSRMHPRRLGDVSTSIAGPLSNLLLAGCSAHLMVTLLILIGFEGRVSGLLSATGFPFEVGSMTLNLIYYLKVFMIFNVWLFLFNMLPVPLLDGGHVVLSLLPPDIAETIRRNGFIVSIVIVMVGSKYIWLAQEWITRGMFQALGQLLGVRVEG